MIVLLTNRNAISFYFFKAQNGAKGNFRILIINCIVNDLSKNNFNLNIRWKWTFEKYDILIETKSDIQNVYQSTKARGPVFFVCLKFCNIHKLNRQNQCFETLFQKQSKRAKEIDAFPRTTDILLAYKTKINDKYVQQSISWKQWFKKLVL